MITRESRQRLVAFISCEGEITSERQVRAVSIDVACASETFVLFW